MGTYLNPGNNGFSRIVKNNYVDKLRIMQLKEKYGCYDDQTEVLTKNGWKYFKDLFLKV